MGAYRLRVIAGAATGTEIAVEDEFVVGRGESGFGSLEGDPEISRRHARVYAVESGELVVEDLGSTNGTKVNGRPISGPRVIRPGDRINVGETTLELVATDRPTEQRARPVPQAAVAQPVQPASAPPLPPFAGSPARAAPTADRRRASRLLVPMVLALLVGVAVAAYFVGHGRSKTVTVAELNSGQLSSGAQGVVYIESNIAAPDGNSVLAFQYGTQGDLRPLHVTEYPTGGAGSADLTDSGVLDADQHLWLDTPKHLLFAVNQGSDTIAVFHVATSGALVPVEGSPFSSGGKGPASIGVSGDIAIVANKAQDGIRDLTKVNPTYATFHIGADGALTQFGPVIKAPPGYSPTDAMVGPDGKFVMSTEEGGPLRAFELGPTGLTQGANSPLQPDASIFPPHFDASKKWGLGLSASPTRKIVYIGMATVNKIGVYRYDDRANLTFVRAVDAPGAELPCWTLLNKGGTRLYTANAGNNTMSVFDLTDPTDPKPLQTLHLHGNGNPWDIRMDPAGKTIFLIDPRARMNVPVGYGQGLHTLLINPDGTLTEPSYSPITVPVGLNVNPFGMAVLGGS